MNSGDPKERKRAEMLKQKKSAAKAMRKAADQEREALFGEALMAVSKKTSVKKKGENSAIGRDGGDAASKKTTSRAMKMMYQMDAKELEDKFKDDPDYVPTLEDEIESQRQAKLKALEKSGRKGTPITEESLKAWQERKRRRKAEEAKKLVETELKKKKGGKGLSVLSGRALYSYNKKLFVDDENAEDKNDIAEREKADDGVTDDDVKEAAASIQSDLFLNGDHDDDDLDDLDED
mmetsp:Transcript_23373/g.53346  ORF Transcript_23373/g.53346 Transcript_23373/m.53346 type:complete len:235 (+) Transcript_23373:537-1241(+)|eukprot:CAMPEP_0113310048 /NCGR_PEP_ID=MMETSP0010_2-20120614/7845_1 /TAXON_ID=216773 ORGANISM="Corethron hystrix, Strain 308" /NCGR_SAMPLE_ID=MMETSP0010_2 /ASSEMBLY_ACC=CAM_ASM_000155 /LENGTH=234 /DNA_ID=CAMNT_0000165417 /DNA_START=109 /DNA_END=813 /DNA_ORIENTATION=+ /assembly_acc=CAM_ASM_000155